MIGLFVVYYDDISACLDFYGKLGMSFARERHGSGPEHYAAALAGGVVFELYPAGKRGATGRIRLGVTVRRDEIDFTLEAGHHVLRDPEGRAVDIRVIDQREDWIEDWPGAQPRIGTSRHRSMPTTTGRIPALPPETDSQE
ncbi:VOC family protein [Frankia nepalensis]|nr:hypothetical protein [Frankia nepalensis]